MSLARRSRTRSSGHSFFVEPLESRRLLTTIQGTGVFEYIDTEDKTVRIAYSGVTAELIFATAGGGQLGHYEDLILGGAEGADLFKVYVTESTMDSYISIAEVDPPGDADKARPMKPYEGSLPKGVGKKGQDGDVIVGDAGSGTILLGTRSGTKESKEGERIPITTAILQAPVGLHPAGQIRAGLEVINQQSLGRFLFGGTVIGTVNVTGNMDTFYAGWLLTGEAAGSSPGGAAPNFIVGGDIRNILTWGSIGTDNIDSLEDFEYTSGFSADVGGYLGQIRSLTHDVNGQVHVRRGDANPSLSTPYRELESRLEDQSSFTAFEVGEFNNPIFFNETFANPQFLGAYATPGTPVPIVAINGSLNPQEGDVEDWYAISVLGGQTITSNVSGAMVVVYDQDLRPIASNIASMGTPFQFTAETPGIYRYQIFNAPFGFYQLVADAGDLALGAVVAADTVVDDFSQFSYSVARGDLGAIFAGNQILAGGQNTVAAFNGNIRVLEAGSIGQFVELLGYSGPSLFTSQSVGLIRATTGYVGMSATAPVGFNYQVIDAAGDVGGVYLANGGIGTIHGATIGGGGPIVISVNADNTGNDGIIDLIASDGDIGTLVNGGPVITTGAGGNVRYVHAGGTVYADPFFGGGAPQETTYGPGQAVTLTDDSGALITLVPFSQPNPFYDPLMPGSELTIGGSITVTALPIRGSGGVAIARITVDGVPVSDMPGNLARSVPELLTILVSGVGISNVAEIGELVVTGSGQGFVQDLRFPVGPNRPARYIVDPDGASVLLTGSGRVDVLDFNGTGNFSSIINNSGGELVTVRAGTVGQLRSATTLGLARTSTGAALRPGIIGANEAFPFSDQRIGVILSGDLMTGASGQGMGNFNVSGSIHHLVANADNVDIHGVFEGINAPIYAGGDIANVNIGEGVLGSGTGVDATLFEVSAPRQNVMPSRAGVYAQGRIGAVVGRNADIRGAIASTGAVTTVPEPGPQPGPISPVVGTGLGSVNLTGGSIVDAFVGVVPDLRMSNRLLAIAFTGGGDTITSPIYSMGPVNINGGGIIGSFVGAAGIHSINVNGFGILSSAIAGSGNSTIGSINANGYGIRNTVITPGAVLGGLHARGNGANVPTYQFSQSVRLSELLPPDPVFQKAYDPYSGTALGARNDLHGFLGTSASNPVINGVTDSGVLEDVSASGSRDLLGVSAYQIRARQDPGTPVDPIATPGGIPASYPMELNFANSIRSIRTTGLINGLQIVTGRLNQFLPATDVFRLGMTVSGPINNIMIRGTLGNDSFINAVGGNGRIGVITIRNDMIGSIFASSAIGRINIGGTLAGNITVIGVTRGLALGALRIGGGLLNGSLNINGNVGNIVSTFGLGQVGDQLTISGNVNQIFVGAGRIPGTVLSSNISVGGNLGVLRVNGRIDGAVSVGGILRNLAVNADAGTGPNLITAPVNVGVNLNNARFVGGNVAADITAGMNVGVFHILHGSLLPGATLMSQFGNINLVRVLNGGLFGSVLAPYGRIGQINVDASIGDGATPMNVTAATIGTFLTRGSVLSGATVTSHGPLVSLVVHGNVEAGAVISGAPIVRRNIRGETNGTIIG